MSVAKGGIDDEDPNIGHDFDERYLFVVA